MNELITMVFVEQPLASPGSAKKGGIKGWLYISDVVEIGAVKKVHCTNATQWKSQGMLNKHCCD